MRASCSRFSVGVIVLAVGGVCRGQVEWSRDVLDASVQPGATLGLSAINVGGQPTIFYLDTLRGTHGNSVMLAQRQNGQWSTQSLLPAASVHYLFLDAITNDGVPYLGVSSAPLSSGQPQAVQLLWRSSGSWQTVYQNAGSAGYGWFMTLGTLHGSVVAAYTGSDAAYYSRSALFLQQNHGSWTESSLGLGNNGGITHLSIAQIRGNPAVLVDTLGGAAYEQRNSGNWVGQSVPIANGSGHVMQYHGEAAFFDTSRVNGNATAPSYWATEQKGQGFNMQQINTGFEVGDDAKVIDGIPTVAYFDRTDHKLHYRELRGTTWTDQVLDSGDADWPEQVSLLNVNGVPAIAYEALQPSGNAMLVYQQMTPQAGDCDHDGIVNFADLRTLAEHFGEHGATWADGDFNNDGVVGLDDLRMLARNYTGNLTAQELNQFEPSFALDVKSAFADVPEPTALAGLGILVLVLVRGRWAGTRSRDTGF